MSAFKSILKINLKKEFAYKTAAISGIITQLFFGIMQITLFTAFLVQGETDFTIVQMSSYIWLQQAFFTLFKFYDCQKFEITNKIISGDVGYQLIRPMNIYNYWYYNVLSKSVGTMIIRAIPLFLIVFLLPAGYGLMLPASWINFLLFVLSAIIGTFLVVAINLISYIIVLYTLSPNGVFSFTVAVASFLAGQVVPIPMLPTSVQTILNFFPFRYISDLPFRIYIGNINGTSAVLQILIQCAWLIAIVLIGKFALSKKIKNLVIQGG